MAKRKEVITTTEEGAEASALDAVLAKFPVLNNPNTIVVQNPSTGLHTALSMASYRIANAKVKSNKSPLAGTVIVYKTDATGTVTDAMGNAI